MADNARKPQHFQTNSSVWKCKKSDLVILYRVVDLCHIKHFKTSPMPPISLRLVEVGSENGENFSGSSKALSQ